MNDTNAFSMTLNTLFSCFKWIFEEVNLDVVLLF
uniref:Uncharacterized protein n=1 Tax=Rhizophora mucronata TaxID=61149 RepID=A0A2P2M0K1_RHIMU